jgi:molybdopterin-guanine dinucleotide biosynthesis protein B
MIPIVSIVGKSGVGKTTLLEKLVGEFKRRGYRVAVIKHHVHTTSLDVPGKDSWRYGQAGADTVIIASPIEVVRFERVAQEKTLAEIAAGIQNVDLILTEGFKREAAPKIEMVRAARGSEIIAPPDDLIAVASDCPVELTVPRFDLDDIKGIATFIVQHFRLGSVERR